MIIDQVKNKTESTGGSRNSSVTTPELNQENVEESTSKLKEAVPPTQDINQEKWNSPDTNSHQSFKKQSLIKDYWLNNPTTTTNRFSSLQEKKTDSNSNKGHVEEQKELKSLPIFVSGVQNIQPLVELLNLTTKDEYTLKVLHNQQVKIQYHKSEKCLPIVQALKLKNTEFYTYQRKIDKNFRVILKNMHPSASTSDLTQELESLGYKVNRITNMLHGKDKTPLRMFIVELAPNNKDIYEISHLLNTNIRFEAPHKKREIPQCLR